MNIQEFETQLSIKELEEFKENFNVKNNPQYYQVFFDDKESFFNTILFAFIWSKTPQGHRYWHNIATRIIDVKL